MPQDYEHGYTIAPPKPLDPNESQWQKIYNEFLETGPSGYEKYRPNLSPSTGEAPATGGGGGGTAPAVGGGSDAVGDPRGPAQGGAGGGGHDGGGGGAGAPGGNPGMVPDNTTNPIDAGSSFLDRLNETFPEGLEGSDPGRFEQFLAQYGDEAVAALGYLAGIPGLGWLVEKIQDWYWADNQWQSPTPDPTLNDLINEAYPPNSSDNFGNAGNFSEPVRSVGDNSAFYTGGSWNSGAGGLGGFGGGGSFWGYGDGWGTGGGGENPIDPTQFYKNQL